MPKQEFDLSKFVPKEEARKTFAKVFDKATIRAVHRLSTKGYFRVVEHVISTGKEAHVFHAVDEAGNSRAVKIYKVGTSDFGRMSDYIEGDPRFEKVKRGKRSLVFAWTRKEFKNLLRMQRAGVNCPLPIAFHENVLVMEFIGKKGKAAPTLKDRPAGDAEKAYGQAVEMLARLLFKAELVYGDFSEYNILNLEEKLFLIDAGQAVLTSHPKASEFFERDLENVARYFSRQRLEKSSEEVKADIKALEGRV